jgi:hypothetical protein
MLYGFWKSPQRIKSLLNLCLAGLVTLPLVLVYYGPNFQFLAANYPTTEQSGLIPWRPYPRHGEPGLDNLLGWIYYPRVLSSYFLFLPLTLFFLVGSIWTGSRSSRTQKESTALLWWWLVGGIVVLTFLTPKDPRFAIPLVTPMALLLLRFWRTFPRVLGFILAVSIAQFLLVSFAMPFTLPKLSVFSRTGDKDFQNIQREWVFFQPEYFGITGPPRKENWSIKEILQKIPEGAEVGVLPELPRFNVNVLQLQAARVGRSERALALGNLDAWEERLEKLDFVLTKTGFQGLSFITGANREIMAKIEAEHWAVIGQWPLPDGSVAKLMRNPTY